MLPDEECANAQNGMKLCIQLNFAAVLLLVLLLLQLLTELKTMF